MLAAVCMRVDVTARARELPRKLVGAGRRGRRECLYTGASVWSSM